MLRTTVLWGDRHKGETQATMDAAAWLLAIWAATWLRYDFDPGAVNVSAWFGCTLVAVVLQTGVGLSVGLYRRKFRYGSTDELVALGFTVAVITPAIAFANWALANPVLGGRLPVSATFTSGVLAVGAMTSARIAWRLFMKRLRFPKGEHVRRAVVFGAGDGGLQVLRAIMTDVQSPYVPVALLDDDPALRGLRMQRVAVEGTRDDLAEVAARFDAEVVIVAVPSADAELVRDISARALDAGLDVRVLPPVAELFAEVIGTADIRPLTEADLLGRREINTDLASVAGYVTDRRVLVTGAGGSIGSELCRQLLRFSPSQLVMLDRDESALQAVQLSIEGRALLDSEDLVVACIRDLDRVREVFDRYRPEVVFHAAALKHLPLLEMHPQEGWKTNVVGTHNLLVAATEFGVERFVNISTDKAADASSVLGATKRAAERLTAFEATCNDSCRFMSVRFGNVLGSRGSVLPLFRQQIADGGPVTVTDERVTRYFMTIPEACELVVQAGAIGDHGDVMVLDMGEPVLIADLARRLIAESGKRVELVFTGLRPGEKLHEVLFSESESPRPSPHPLISVVGVPPASVAELAESAGEPRRPEVDLRSGASAV